jgi:alpha-L-fucosidase
MLIETAAKGGNLLLGVGPDPTGLIPAPAAERLREIGDWLRTYGEAIYGTRPIPPYQSGSVRFTKKGRHVYAFIMKEKGDAPSRVVVKGLCPKARSKVVWMKNSTPVAWKAEADGFAVDVPQDPSSIIPVVVLKLEMSSR